MRKFFCGVAAISLAVYIFCPALRAEDSKNNSSNTQAIQDWLQKNTGNSAEQFAEKINEIQGALRESGDQGGLKKLSEASLQNAAESALGAKPAAAGTPIAGSERANYRIQPGDKLTIKIYPEDPYIKGGETQVSPDGNVTLPLLGKIPLAGKTMDEAQQVVQQILDRDYLVDPEVTIEVMETRERSFVVLGQVKKPGTFQFPAGATKFSLLEAISMAGGFSDIANIKKIKILRPQGDNTKKVIQANAEAIIAGQEADIPLEQGDVINVAESLF